MAENDSPKVVGSTTTDPVEQGSASLVPWTLAWIQAVERERDAAVARREEQHAG